MTWICIVDDDPEVGDALTAALRVAGYGARSFRDGSDALEAIVTALEAPRLILLDLILPNMSGRDVLRRIRLDPHASQVPVIVITGLDNVLESSFAPARISAILRKPIAVEDLLATITSVLRAANA